MAGDNNLKKWGTATVGEEAGATWPTDIWTCPDTHQSVPQLRVNNTAALWSAREQRLREYILTETLEWSPTGRWWEKLATFQQPLHPGSSPAVSTVSFYWIKKTWDVRVRLSLHNISSLKFMCMSGLWCQQSPVVMGMWQNSKCRLHSCCSHQPAHMVAQGYRFISLLNWSNSGTQQPSEWLSSHCSAHLYGMRKGLEKVP